MKQISKMTQAEVAAHVQSHLRNHNILVTLSGGAAVSIYMVNRSFFFLHNKEFDRLFQSIWAVKYLSTA